MKVLIMAGGRGARFWPLSQPEFPKQCIRWNDSETLLHQAIHRANKLAKLEDIFIITGPKMRSAIEDSLVGTGINHSQIIVEPTARNTAPCIALALGIIGSEPSSILIMPADHLIQDSDEWVRCVRSAQSECLNRAQPVLFGINPTIPHTGYGYIEATTPLIANQLSPVVRFREKPSHIQANAFLKKGHFLWNAGMILTQLEQLELAFKKYLPQCHRYLQSLRDGSPIDGLWFETEEISLDYGILEHMSDLMVIAMDVGWSDVGSWDSAHLVLPKTEYGHGKAPFVSSVQSTNCVVMSEQMEIALVGVNNLVVVQNGNQLLVMNKDSAQSVRTAVTEIEKKPRK
ncbi:MAG: mannose-1-phosphate guanylyltransferase [Myxococcota bacterium]